MNKNRRKERQGKAYTRMQATSGGIHREVTSQVRRFEAAETSWYPELQVEIATSPGCVPFHWSELPERTGSPQSTGTDTHTCSFFGWRHPHAYFRFCADQCLTLAFDSLAGGCLRFPSVCKSDRVAECRVKNKQNKTKNPQRICIPVTATTTTGRQRQHQQQHLNVNRWLTAF